MRVSEGVFVEVVDVGYAEVEGGEEDDADGGEVAKEVERGEEGAKDDFFGYGALFLTQSFRLRGH